MEVWACGVGKMEVEMEVSVMELYLELTVSEGTATITQCYYVDKRARGKKISP